MKRTRDAVHPSRGERDGRSRGGVGGDGGGRASRRPTPTDAMSYLKEVEAAFRDQPAKYSRFLEIMEGFTTERIDRAVAVANAKKLLKGHSRLIDGFNTFLAEEGEIALDETPAKKKPVTFEEAVGLVRKIKKYFRDEEHVYPSFMNILETYRSGRGVGAIYNEVSDLFAGHPHFIEAFKRFLPKNFQEELSTELSSITTN